MHFFVIALPIGNTADLGGRARQILEQANLLICEERRVAETFFRRSQLRVKNPLSEENLIVYNEHSTLKEIHTRLFAFADAFQGEDPAQIAWICDSGTPNFADPGRELLALIYAQSAKIAHRAPSQPSVPSEPSVSSQPSVSSGGHVWQVSPVPGPSALMAVLSVCDFDIRNFYYAGFLSRQEKMRQRELQRLRSFSVAIIVQEPPYRYAALLQSIAKVYPANWPLLAAFDLTRENEYIFRGTVSQLLQKRIPMRSAKPKRLPEFMLILAGKLSTDAVPLIGRA